MELKEIYKRLITIRTLLDENTPKGKQALTNFIKELEDVLFKEN